MSTIAKDKLADLVTLPFPVKREIVIALQDQMEDEADAEEARQVLAAIERGEEEVLDWEEVKKELGL